MGGERVEPQISPPKLQKNLLSADKWVIFRKKIVFLLIVNVLNIPYYIAMKKKKNTAAPAMTLTPSSRRPKQLRKHRLAFLLNDNEKRVIDFYVQRYGVKNVSGFVREAVIRTALRQLDQDSPTLFD